MTTAEHTAASPLLIETTPVRSGRFDLSLVPLGLAGLFLAFLVLLPLGWLLAYSVTDENGALSLANFAELGDPSLFLDPFITTLGIAMGVASMACLVAVPLAWLLARTDVPGRRTLRALVMVSFITPPFIGAVAWVLLAAPNSGLLNQYYRWLTGAGPFDHLFNIFSAAGIIFVMGSYAFPYVFVLAAIRWTACHTTWRRPAPFWAAAAGTHFGESRCRWCCRPCWRAS